MILYAQTSFKTKKFNGIAVEERMLDGERVRQPKLLDSAHIPLS
jgi:hypothetical protein